MSVSSTLIGGGEWLAAAGGGTGRVEDEGVVVEGGWSPVGPGG